MYQLKNLNGLQELGQLIRKCRGSRSLQSFSEKVGVAKRTVERLEKAENTPRIETLQRFTEELGLEVEDMVAIAEGTQSKPRQVVLKGLNTRENLILREIEGLFNLVRKEEQEIIISRLRRIVS